MTRAILLHPLLPDMDPTDAEHDLAEAVSLLSAVSLKAGASEIVRVARPNPATLFGRGKVDELTELVATEHADLVIVNASVTPVQQRNLERALSAKVLDRTGLILEIFGERAQTREGVLQVDLAHLEYQKSRLVRSWTHLERQRGGAGFMGGPGERQIESDRRQLDEQIARLRRQLDKVVRTRTLHRAARKRVPYPIVALVGYTNAGKSTLFNHLTSAKVRAEDLLFATLDPTMRQITLPSGRPAILSDTVGFISNLPTQLVAAFRATLEEVLEADLLVHVRDIAHPKTEAQKADVDSVLAMLGHAEDSKTPLIEAYNKIDLLSEPDRMAVDNLAARNDAVFPISAVCGTGCAELVAAIEARLFPELLGMEVRLGHDQGAAVSWLYDHAEVTARHDDETGTDLSVTLTEREYFQFQKAFPDAREDVRTHPLAAQ